MKTANKILAMIFVGGAATFFMPAVAAENDSDAAPLTTKQERNLIREGNSLYRQKRFSEAEVKYRKALEEVPQSETALFNLAASLIRQSGSADPNSGNNPLKEASDVLRQLGKEGYDINLSGKSFYNLGNMAFNNSDFAGAVDMYKNSLRKNPDDDKARQNLRIAQKKLQEQQQNQQNQDQQQNKDKQDQQDQNQDQQQNQDKQDQQDKNQNQDQQQQQQDKKDQQKQQQQQQMSDSNADKILKAMENEEAATRKRVEAEKKKAAAARKKHVTNPW